MLWGKINAIKMVVAQLYLNDLTTDHQGTTQFTEWTKLMTESASFEYPIARMNNSNEYV